MPAAAVYERCLRIGDTIPGRITKVVPYVGVLIDIGAGYDVLLPKEHYGKKLKRPRVGYELAYLEVLDVDPDAAEECRRVILGAEDCINLTPSRLLITPESSRRTSLQSSPQVLTPATSCHTSPRMNPKQSPSLENLEAFELEAHAPAPKPLGEAAPQEEDGAFDPVTTLRQTLLDKADELGVARPQLAPVLESFDALELQLTVLGKAHELGIAESQLAPVLRSINGLSRKVGGGPRHHDRLAAKAPAQVPMTTRCWHNGARGNSRTAVQAS